MLITQECSSYCWAVLAERQGLLCFPLSPTASTLGRRLCRDTARTAGSGWQKGYPTPCNTSLSNKNFVQGFLPGDHCSGTGWLSVRWCWQLSVSLDFLSFFFNIILHTLTPFYLLSCLYPNSVFLIFALLILSSIPIPVWVASKLCGAQLPTEVNASDVGFSPASVLGERLPSVNPNFLFLKSYIMWHSWNNDTECNMPIWWTSMQMQLWSIPLQPSFTMMQTLTGVDILTEENSGIK